ncbi:hypothetical protein [Aminipila luticellarii]|uniref:Uncharacterized protein n=1 Tax=Aminipila luticellarii TaxID=2507160 RepID=A0A410PWI3_9FIRM|nr:hypothetical protein [Aminipila luticellarii]QAT43291.1 hypothetical protein EQM06_08700 [Aminipila luticellarii]
MEEEKTNEALKDVLTNQEDGDRKQDDASNQEPIEETFYKDNKREADPKSNSLDAFQDQGKIQLAEDEKRIYEGLL